MPGSLLDVVLVVAVVLFAISGYRQGLVVGVLSFFGFFGGGFLGTQVAPPIATQVASGASQPLVGVAVVLAVACVGQLLSLAVGHALRRRLRWRGVRALDSAGGAVVSVVAALLVVWLIATPLASSGYPVVASLIRRSVIIRTVDAVVPDQVRSLYASFRRLVDRGSFPDVYGPLSPTRVPGAAPPDAVIVNSRAVAQARPSIVKVIGMAPGCSRRLEGSGFVYAPEHVMTNAHVVAGVHRLQVQFGNQHLDGFVVLYDPDRDVAVIWVPGLRRPALQFAAPVDAGTNAVVVGFPLDGPFTATPARVRSQQRVRGPDIYSARTVVRQVYSLRADVRSGNSGGPLLSAGGRVLGVVFAAAADEPDTGFALTAGEVSSDASAAAGSTVAVSTQTCD
ncbi:MAG: MarP family serine protease [Actinomycetota bacterium]|nr:MarP family serine protease [Actinomycetota bacterium]